MSLERVIAGALGLSGFAPALDPDWNVWMDANLRKLSVLTYLKVISQTTSLPAGSEGDVYIVPDGDANEKQIAVYDGGAWNYITPVQGMQAYVTDILSRLEYDGTNWGPIGLGSFQNLTDSPASYTGQAGQVVAVNAAEDGVEFVTPGSFNSINAQVGTTYTPVLADAKNVLMTMDNASAITLTIPANASVAYPINSILTWVQLGAGTVTAAPDTGVTLLSRGSLLDTAGQYAVVTAVKIAADTWLVTGDLA